MAALLGGAGNSLNAQQPPAATPSLAQEYGRVFTAHETALAAAHATEDRRYQAALASLATRAQRSGDTNTVYAVQQTLVGLTTRPAPPSAETLAAMAPYVGGWDCLTGWGYRYSLLFLPDGTMERANHHEGTWALEDDRLVLHGKDWMDFYLLPSHDGVLNGKTGDNAHDMTLTRRGMGGTAVLEASLLGDWTSRFPHGNDPVYLTLSPGGGMTDNRHLGGSWQIVNHELVITFDAHQDWRDTYPLPVGPDGTATGRNVFGNDLVLTRDTHSAASAAPAAAAGTGSAGTYFGAKLPASGR